jgi:cyanophycinase-like exopeptidase
MERSKLDLWVGLFVCAGIGALLILAMKVGNMSSIGLGEDTGVIISGNNMMEVIGSGAVVIVDGRDINYSNIADIPEGTPISIENLRVNILVSGNSYDLKKRKFIAGVQVPLEVD